MDHSLCKQCKGYCCDDFAVTISPDRMENSYHRWLKKGDGFDHVGLSPLSEVETRYYIDIHLIYPMLIFTHKDNIHPDGDIIANKTIYHYRCKHHNQKTKMCDIHEIRPMVCRTFPNNGFCGYKNVKIKEVIEGRPKWFKFGLDNADWIALRDGEDTQEDVIIKKLDNINNMLERYNNPDDRDKECVKLVEK